MRRALLSGGSRSIGRVCYGVRKYAAPPRVDRCNDELVVFHQVQRNVRSRLRLLLLVVAVPSLGQAYMASYSAYDTKRCVFVSFELSPPDAPNDATVVGYTQPVQWSGNATDIKGRVSMKGAE